MIDTSIVNVALTEMQVNLGATISEIGWVITGYAIANVILIPLTAWLGEYFGQKSYFIISLVGRYHYYNVSISDNCLCYPPGSICDGV